jgi:hypothetical protein
VGVLPLSYVIGEEKVDAVCLGLRRMSHCKGLLVSLLQRILQTLQGVERGRLACTSGTKAQQNVDLTGRLQGEREREREREREGKRVCDQWVFCFVSVTVCNCL